MRKEKPQSKDADFLPDHIGASFETQLISLLEVISDEEGFKGNYLKEQCFSKYCSPKTVKPDVRRARAITKWLDTERRNASTNMRLQLLDPDYSFGWTTWFQLRRSIRKIVSEVLGPLKYPLVLWDSGYTNGASTRVKRSLTSRYEKLTGTAHGSTSAILHWPLATVHTVLEDQIVVARESSSLFTVPKSTEIDRVACKEPEINMFLQRSVGNHIRSRLRSRRFGINLNDQTRNQELARHAVKRNLATIDLSSASDSISSQLVFELLPFEWWSLLDDIRVKEVVIGEGTKEEYTHALSMFSSMGNGFTFELESLLFYAITRAVCLLSGVRGEISVYGDDIIAPCRICPRLKRVFDMLGFRMNEAKTFWTGQFRESCGKHYYRGVDVSPFFVREPIRTKSELIRVLNRLAEWSSRSYGFITSHAIVDFHYRWAQQVPQQLWGGQDYQSTDSLVTGHPPRKRLVQSKHPVTVNEEIRLKSWFVHRRLTGTTPLTDVSRTVGPESVQLFDPCLYRLGRFRLAPHDPWQVRTSETPWLFLEQPGGR